MRNRVVLALFLALLLVGGATWMRVKNSRAASPSLVSVDTPALEIYNSDDFWKNNSASSTPNAPKSDTDLIARSLLLDYVNLATSGQASEENLTALADKYAEKIPALKNADSIGLADLNAVSNTIENFQHYDSEATRIHVKYSGRIDQVYRPEEDLTTLGPELYSFLDGVGSEYESMALELQNLPVPFSVADLHMQLINAYLSTAAGLRALSKIDENPAGALSGLVTVRSKFKEEQDIIQEINQVLNKNGI